MGINEYMQSHDVSNADVAPFLLIHTVLSAVLVGSTWWWCYWGSGRILPPNNAFQNEIPRSMLLNSLLAMPMISDGIKRKASRALVTLEKTSRSSRPVRYLEQKIPSLDATRVCVSYAEAKFGRLFLKPLTVPGRIWMSWKMTKMMKHKHMTNHNTFANGRRRSGDNKKLPNAAFAIERHRAQQLYDPTCIHIPSASSAIINRECRDFYHL